MELNTINPLHIIYKKMVRWNPPTKYWKPYLPKLFKCTIKTRLIDFHKHYGPTGLPGGIVQDTLDHVKNKYKLEKKQLKNKYTELLELEKST